MTEPIFFEIPIYRLSRAQHTAVMNKHIEKINKEIPASLHPESNQNMLDYFHASLWYAWNYNELMGYLNLYILGSQFRGDIWLVQKKRHNAGIVKKKFRLLGKEFEKQIPRNLSSEQIFTFMVNQLEYINKKYYKRRFFDLKAFKVIGSFIDWKLLIERLNSYSFPDFRRAYFEND